MSIAAGTSRKVSQPSPTAPDLQDKIRSRAYELYLLRGPAAGDALQDWLRAEAELTAAPAQKPARSRQIKATAASATGKKK